MDGDVEHIEQVSPQQSLSEQTMAVYEKIPAIPLFELRRLVHDVDPDDGRVVPVGLFQSRRENVLLDRN